MKFPNYDAEYAKYENKDRGFQNFIDCFKDVYEKEDFEVIQLFAPIAKMLIEKELPQIEQPPHDNKKFTLKSLLESLKPIFDSILAKYNNKSINTIQGKLKSLKGKNDVSYAETHVMTEHISEQIAPVLQLKINELFNAGKIVTNETEDTEIHEERLIENTNEFRIIKRMIEMIESEGGEDLRLESLRKDMVLAQHNMEKQKRIIEEKSKTKVGSSYFRNKNKINLDQRYTIEDALSLIHETAHAVTLDNSKRLSEIPSITAEIIAEKYLGLHGMKASFEVSGINNRVADMHRKAKFVSALNDVFQEYEQTGSIQFETMENFKKINDNKILDKEVIKLENYPYMNIHNFFEMLSFSMYFIGTTSALVLAEQIKTKEDLQNVFEVISMKKISDVQKLQMLGINKESLTYSVNNFINKNRKDIAQAKAKLDKLFKEKRKEKEEREKRIEGKGDLGT